MTHSNSCTIRTLTLVSVLVSLVVPFWPSFNKMTYRWSSDDSSYCYLIIPLFLYLCWEQRALFRFEVFSVKGWGLVAALASIFVVFLGELGSVETLVFLGLWGCLTSIIITTYGLRSRALLFPIIILLFIVPLPPFKLLVSKISAGMLRLIGISVLLEGNILDLGATRLEVVDACSGLRYLMSLVLLALLMGHYFARRWWQQGVLLSMVFPLLIILNSARIFMSGILTIMGHAELTQGAFHDVTGIIFFLVAGVLFYFTSRMMSTLVPQALTGQTLQTQTPVATPEGGRNALLPMGFLFLIFLVSGVIFQQIPKSSTSPERLQFASFPLTIGPWQGEAHPLADDIVKALWADDYLNATYVHKETKNLTYLLIPFYEYQGTRHTAHAPQSCLLGGGFVITSSLERHIGLPDGKNISIVTMRMEKNDNKLLASYFFLQRGRVITNPWLNKYFLMVDALVKRRTDGALVRVEMTVPPNQNFEVAQALHDDFIKEMWPLLKQYVPE